MTPQEILEYNKRCAEFLGCKLIHKEDFNMLGEHAYTGENKDIKWGIIEYLKFHLDWNWIMEVVEAIEKLGYRVLMVTDEVDIESNAENPIQKSFGTYCPDGTKKEAVVQAINNFLIWYNEQ